MSDGEVLLALNAALKGVQTKVVKSGPKVDKIRIISAQRAETQDKISKELIRVRPLFL